MIDISVIVPIYNSERFLRESLLCLSCQKLSNIEFILINDGSLDSSESIIKEFLHQDDRFIYIKKNENSGYGATCNLGIESSRGKYVAFFEPDDLIPSDFFECLYAKTLKGDVDVVKYNGIIKFYDFRERFLKVFSLKEFPEGVFGGGIYPRLWRAHPSITNGIYKKECLQRHGICFPQGSGASYQDVQFSVSLFYANPKVLIVDDCKYFYRQHDGQSIATMSSSVLESVIYNWTEFFLSNSDLIHSSDVWFANIQMYRQFNTLSQRFHKSEVKKLNYFYSQHIKNSSIPKVHHLKWFNFSRSEILFFYWYSLRRLFF